MAAAGSVPPTSSDHPATWKFDHPIYHAETRDQWRAWPRRPRVNAPRDGQPELPPPAPDREIDMNRIATHPMMTNPPTAYGAALALADTFRPDRYVQRQGNHDVLDADLVRADISIVSTGEGVLLSLVNSLAGESPCDLSRLDAVDREGRQLLADTFAALANR